MASLSVRLPLERNSSDGFQMIKSFKDMIKQNFKMLLLTSPGERVMEPEFGVGLRQYLFENFSESTFAKIERNILKQAKIYLPAVAIEEVFFTAMDENANALSVRIKYAVPNLNTKDLLEFTI
jgi:phage baseplate assembly protein W|tara:strand:- start:10326 stop:10694 length:369 start_codon:yes stop_codon:yes gene_type:complete